MKRQSSSSRTATVLVTVALCVSLIGGCQGGNKGGDTTCGDFLAMSASDQTAAVQKLLEESGESDVSNGMIALNVAGVQLFCSTLGSDSSKIREIDG